MTNEKSMTTTPKLYRKWTKEEEKRLIQQVKTFPQNLNKCFAVVADVLGRTPGAVANHWYTKTSRGEELAFGFISPVNFVRNRKNGLGVAIKPTVWNKFVNLVKNIF